MTSPANEKTIYWQSILEKWKNSGLSQMAFSMHEGIDSRRLGYWKKALIARGQDGETVAKVARAAASTIQLNGPKICKNDLIDSPKICKYI